MLFGEDVIHMIINFRIAWIGGRYGGGKTALAERLAAELVDRGKADHIVGNFASVWHTDISTIECRDAVIILDEAGVWLADKDFNKMTAFLRKRNLYVILSSVLPVATRAKTVNFQRTANLRSIGLPLWRYTLNLDYMNQHDSYGLNWIDPTEIFGIYDTDAIAEDDAGILRWVYDSFRKKEVVSERGKALGVGAGVIDFGEFARDEKAPEIDVWQEEPDLSGWGGIQSMESGGRVAEEIAQAAEAIHQSLPLFKRAARRARRR